MVPATVLLPLDSGRVLEDVILFLLAQVVMCLHRSVWRTHQEVLVCLMYTHSLIQSAGKRMMI